jgi:hypothetical protein
MVHAYTSWLSQSSWAIHSRYLFDALAQLTPISVWPCDVPSPPASRILLGSEAPHMILKDVGIGLGPLNRLHLVNTSEKIGYAIFESTAQRSVIKQWV